MSELPTSVDHNDAPDADLAPVVDGLRGLDPVSVKAVLDRKFEETQAVDPSVGIVIADLPEVEPILLNGQTFRFHGARILSAGEGTPNYVKPHVHDQGQEPYVILDGTGGEMNTGVITGERVEWDKEPHSVLPGEIIVVQESQVHSLRNTSMHKPLDFAFACPDSHLQDRTLENPKGDRVFTAHLDKPLPPHYQPEL